MYLDSIMEDFSVAKLREHFIDRWCTAAKLRERFITRWCLAAKLRGHFIARWCLVAKLREHFIARWCLAAKLREHFIDRWCLAEQLRHYFSPLLRFVAKLLQQIFFRRSAFICSLPDEMAKVYQNITPRKRCSYKEKLLKNVIRFERNYLYMSGYASFCNATNIWN